MLPAEPLMAAADGGKPATAGGDAFEPERELDESDDGENEAGTELV